MKRYHAMIVLPRDLRFRLYLLRQVFSRRPEIHIHQTKRGWKKGAPK